MCSRAGILRTGFCFLSFTCSMSSSGQWPERWRGGMSSATADQASGSPDLDPTLTTRQRKIVRFISGWVQEHGYSPSMREIGRAVGLTSTSSVEHQLAALQAKGYLRRAAGCPRTVEVRLPGQPPVPLPPGPATARAPRRPARSPKPAARVPLVGRIADGAPVPAEG